MAQHVVVTLSITLTPSREYRVVYTLRYARASAASGFIIPKEAQLRGFLQYFALAPEVIAQCLTSVHAGRTELLRLGALDHDHAERVLRRGVLWRKRSFGSRSDRGIRFAERILTVVQTRRLQRERVFPFLVEAVSARRAGKAAPSLLPA